MSIGRIHLLPLLLVALVWIWGAADFREHQAEHLAEADRFGSAVLSGSGGEVLRICRGGQYDPDEMQSTLEEIRSRLSAPRIALTTEDGQVIAEASEADFAPTQNGYFSAPFRSLKPRGKGGPPWMESSLVRLPSGLLFLELNLPMESLDARLDSDLRRFLLVSGALTLAILLAALAVGQRLRGMELRLSLAEKDQKLSSLEYLGRLGAGLAHETRNPLGIVRGFAQGLLDKPSDEERVLKSATTIVAQTDRTLARLDEFMLLSRPAELRRESVEFGSLTQDLGMLVEADLEAKQATLDIESFTLHADGDREQLRRLLMNLLLNAVQAIGEGGRVRISKSSHDNLKGVSIEDDGPGIPGDLLDTLFEPYVSRREGGTGLGLAIAKRIAIEHGWELTAGKSELGGARFRLEWEAQS